jgi:4-amino-4-deoxy-L-arabinose transferase-like glycosyltransferase
LNTTPPDSRSPGKFGRKSLLLFLAVVALAAPQAALLPLIDRDEPRFAEASREMLQSGNFIVPTFNHAPRYAKPPLIYWCQAAAYTLFGENAFAARLPSLAATAATAVLLLTWGRQLGSEAIGLGAAVSYAFCLQTVQQGRIATADALLIFFMTLTAFTGWKIIRPQASGPVRCVCFVVLALGFAGGFLAKGPEALLPFFPLLWCARYGNRSAVAGLIASFVTGLGLVLLWAIPAYIETHGDYWREGLSEGIGQRMVSGLQGHGATTFGSYLLTLPLYFILFWLSALPWSPLLLLHRRRLFAGWKPDFLDAYLLLNAGLIFLVFSLMVTKLPSYTLPAFPLVALVFARRWFSAALPSTWPVRLAAGFGIMLALLTAVLIPVALARHATPSPVGDLVRDAGDLLTPQTEYALVDFQEPSAIWEMRHVSQKYGQFIPESEVISFLRKSGPHAVVLSTAAWQRVRADSDAAWKTVEARGWKSTKGSSIDLTLVVKQ